MILHLPAQLPCVLVARTPTDEAREGPMIVPPLTVDLDRMPSSVTFDLNQERPTSILALQNHTTQPVCFKVMSTEPSKYFVSPAQGIISPKAMGHVAIFIPCNAATSEVFQDGEDRFMILHVPLIGQAFDYHTLTSAQLTTLWPTFSSEAMRRQKFSARFIRRSSSSFVSPTKGAGSAPLEASSSLSPSANPAPPPRLFRLWAASSHNSESSSP